jgi:hypothetical protein
MKRCVRGREQSERLRLMTMTYDDEAGNEKAGNDNETEALVVYLYCKAGNDERGAGLCVYFLSTFSDGPYARAYADRGYRVSRNPCHIPDKGTCALKNEPVSKSSTNQIDRTNERKSQRLTFLISMYTPHMSLQVLSPRKTLATSRDLAHMNPRSLRSTSLL